VNLLGRLKCFVVAKKQEVSITVLIKGWCDGMKQVGGYKQCRSRKAVKNVLLATAQLYS